VALNDFTSSRDIRPLIPKYSAKQWLRSSKLYCLVLLQVSRSDLEYFKNILAYIITAAP